MRKAILAIAAIAVVMATPALVKAGPMAPGSPPWSGFYAGLTFGWGWQDQTVTATGNDFLLTAVLNGAGGLIGEQPVGPGSFRNKGAFGGIEAGWNWQAGRYIGGIEADFSFSDITGQGAVTSILQIRPVATFLQQLSAKQDVLWFGTLRPRLGWLATDNLLLYGTGGLAYGRVYQAVNLGFNPPVGLNGSFSCPANFGNCVYGQSHHIGVGWTAGAGAELLVPGTKVSLKVEYLFVDLGSTRVTAVALNPLAGTPPSSFSAAFSRTEFSTVRGGLNWNF